MGVTIDESMVVRCSNEDTGVSLESLLTSLAERINPGGMETDDNDESKKRVDLARIKAICATVMMEEYGTMLYGQGESPATLKTEMVTARRESLYGEPSV